MRSIAGRGGNRRRAGANARSEPLGERRANALTIFFEMSSNFFENVHKQFIGAHSSTVERFPFKEEVWRFESSWAHRVKLGFAVVDEGQVRLGYFFSFCCNIKEESQTFF